MSRFSLGRIGTALAARLKSTGGMVAGLTRNPQRLLHVATAAAIVLLLVRGRASEPPPQPEPRVQSDSVRDTPSEAAAAGQGERAQTAAGGVAATEAKAVATAADEQPAVPPAIAASEEKPAAALPSFQDQRPLATLEAAPAEGPKAAAAPSFRDARPVAAPSFHDQRSVVPPEQAAIVPAPSAPPPAAASSSAGPTLVAMPPATLKVDAGNCPASEISTEALDGGRMRLVIAAPCHPGEAVQISYGGAEIIRRLDARGGLDYALDCFAGAAAPAELRFADGQRKSVAINARDLDTVSKIAVIWRAAVNLDLHVFEYAARFDQPGHLWAKAPSSLEAARSLAANDKRGHGFISAADDETSLGDKVEVYTFLHSDEQTSGAISLALDYETRGEVPSGATCGQGALAEVDFQVSMRPRGGQTTRQAGVLTKVECGQRIAREARLNQAALPGLRIRR